VGPLRAKRETRSINACSQEKYRLRVLSKGFGARGAGKAVLGNTLSGLTPGDVIGFDEVSVTPEPSSLWLLATGLAGLLGWRRRA
jgi:hypothetical protein